MPELSQKLGAKPSTEVTVFFTTRRAELERRFPTLKKTLELAVMSAAIGERGQALRFVYRLQDR